MRTNLRNRKEMMMKVAIIGSREYTNKRKIKDFVFQLKEKFGDELEIVSGGAKQGSDKYAKQFALEFGINYSEFPPYHEPHNIHCIHGAFRYGKPYNVGYYHKRNKEIVEYSDYVSAFVSNPERISRGTGSALEYCRKNNKKFVILD
jgi:hypothetical protein